MKRRSELVAVLLGAAALLCPAAASAYCRTAACESKDVAWQVCTPAEPDDCGEPLYWAKQCVGFTLQKDASVQVSLKDAEAVFTAAFETWMNVDCGGGLHPSISAEYQGTVECDAQEYNKTKGNANIITFRDDFWPYADKGTVLALTTVTYNLETSEIFDADMELNSASIDSFTLGNDDVKYDLLSIATHETGHFLGLAHSKETDATMFTDYKPGSTWLRDPTPDDIAGICEIYPPLAPRSLTCDPEPRHGFSSKCGKDQPENGGGGDDAGEGGTGSCGVSAHAGERPSPRALLGLLGLVALGGLRRKLSRNRRTPAPTGEVER